MENAKLIELALGILAIGTILLSGFLFARQSDRAAVPKANNK